MVDSKCILVSTSKLFVDRHYRQIPTIKPIKRTRLFNEDENLVSGLDDYRYFSHYFGDTIVPIDRTNTIVTPFNTTLHPVLELPQTQSDKKFSDCCDERASALVQSGKYVNVMYGGGIDSVAMLVALLKNSSEKQRSSIRIIMSNESISRNQKAYDKLICGKFNIIPSYEFDSRMGNKNSIFVTGECGDEIFGTSFIQNIMYRSEVDVMTEEPTLSTIMMLLRKNVIVETEEEQRQHRRFVEMLFAVTEKSPAQLDTVYKFLWWLNFVLSWNVSYTRLMTFSNGSVLPEQNYAPFYATADFQNWSIANVDVLSIQKQAAKDYINEYCDGLMTNNLVKSNSLAAVCYNKPSVFAIDELNNIHREPYNIFVENNSFVC